MSKIADISFGQPISDDDEKQAAQEVLSSPILVHGPKVNTSEN